MTPKFAKLIQMLKSETERGKLTWVAVDDEAFRARVGDGLVRVAKGYKRSEPESGEALLIPTINIVVTGPTARVVEDESFLEDEASYAAPEALFQAVRRAALNSDAVLDSMMQSLQSSAN